MANQQKKAIPSPMCTVEDGSPTFAFPDGARLQVSHPKHDKWGGLWADVTATANGQRVYRANVNLLNIHSCVDFDARAREYDGRIDWNGCLQASMAGVEAFLQERTPAPGSPTDVGGRRPHIVPADTVAPQPIRWLWEPYIPLGMLVMLDGDPGLGKSMMLLQVAANLSRGRPFLDQTGKPTLTPDVDGPQTTIVLSAEDSLSHVMVPRLNAAGADLSHIKFMDGCLGAEDQVYAFDLQHLSVLVQAIEEYTPALVILDPLVAYLGDIDMHRANQTRPLMAALTQLSERYACTIVGVRHPAKLDQGGRLMYRGQGNIDIVGAARSGLWVQQHPSYPDTRTLMIHAKTNVGMPGRTVIFSRERGEFAWVGASRLTEGMLTGRGPEPYAFLDAFFWFEEVMRPGIPMKAAELEKDAAERDISHKVLTRAKKALGITSRQVTGGWTWTLPPLSTPSSLDRTLLTTTKDTGYTEDTGSTGSTGYSEPISTGYDPDTQIHPVVPTPPEYPVSPVAIRARARGTSKRDSESMSYDPEVAVGGVVVVDAERGVGAVESREREPGEEG